MNKKQKIRLWSITGIIAILAIAMSLVLYALKQNIDLFFTPSQLQETQVTPGQVIRIGGYVKMHSVKYDTSGQHVQFTVTDKSHDLAVSYSGVLPNLFREGQGVVIEGTLNPNHTFAASQVLAKHDEKYMPRSLEKVLNKGK